MSQYKIILAGAPRVGKSTIYKYIRNQTNLECSHLSRVQENLAPNGPESLPDIAGQQSFVYHLESRNQSKMVRSHCMHSYII